MVERSGLVLVFFAKLICLSLFVREERFAKHFMVELRLNLQNM